MEFKVKYCIGPLLLLFTWTTSAEDTSFKAKFGEEFGTDLRKYHAEMLHSNMDHYEELFNLLLRDTKPTPDEKQRFKSYLETIKHFKSQLGETVGISLIKEMKSFGEVMMHGLAIYRLGKDISDKDTVQTILARSTEYEKNDAKDFQKKIYKRFHEMYKKIPAEELEKYYEYTEIDKLLEKVSNRSIETLGTVGGFIDHVSVFRKLGEFFEYPEYKEMFA